MTQHKQEKLMLAEHVLEVRHIASGGFLDVRGFVADYIKKAGLFPHWRIEPNIIHFQDGPDKSNKDAAFAGYKSTGYVVYNADTRNYFSDRASRFWKTLLKNSHYVIPDIVRFGARTKVFIPTEKNFDDVNAAIFGVLLSTKAIGLLGGKEKDVQFILNLTEEEFDVRVSGGPIHHNEAGKHLNFESEHFKKCGLFLDVDFSKTKEISGDVVPRLLSRAIDLTWAKVERIASALGI